MAGLGLVGAMGAAGGEDALKQMIVQRLQQEALQRQQQQQQIENEQKNRALGQGDTRLGLEQQQLDMASQPKPQGPMMVAPNTTIYQPGQGAIYTAPPAPEKPDRSFEDFRQKYDYELQHPKPSTAAPEKERTIGVDTVDDQGNSITKYVTESQARGQSFKKPTPGGAGGGQLGLQGARADSAIQMLEHLQSVHRQLGTKNGPGQLMRGAMDTVKGALNMKNSATEYQKLRKATAVALAVAIQGSRPSDADADAMASMIPDFNTPSDVAGNLFEGLKQQLAKTSANMHNTRQPMQTAAPTDAHPPLEKFGGTYIWDGKKYVRQP